MIGKLTRHSKENSFETFFSRKSTTTQHSARDPSATPNCSTDFTDFRTFHRFHCLNSTCLSKLKEPAKATACRTTGRSRSAHQPSLRWIRAWRTVIRSSLLVPLLDPKIPTHWTRMSVGWSTSRPPQHSKLIQELQIQKEIRWCWNTRFKCYIRKGQQCSRLLHSNFF